MKSRQNLITAVREVILRSRYWREVFRRRPAERVRKGTDRVRQGEAGQGDQEAGNGEREGEEQEGNWR